jgi:hypothetical protein
MIPNIVSNRHMCPSIKKLKTYLTHNHLIHPLSLHRLHHTASSARRPRTHENVTREHVRWILRLRTGTRRARRRLLLGSSSSSRSRRHATVSDVRLVQAIEARI